MSQLSVRNYFFFFTSLSLFNLVRLIMSVNLCSNSVDQDLSDVDDEEAYDYKFVRWMIKEKVQILFSNFIVSAASV